MATPSRRFSGFRLSAINYQPWTINHPTLYRRPPAIGSTTAASFDANPWEGDGADWTLAGPVTVNADPNNSLYASGAGNAGSGAGNAGGRQEKNRRYHPEANRQ